MTDLPEWLRHVPPLSDDEFAAFDQRMAEHEHEADRIAALAIARAGIAAAKEKKR